MPRNGTMTLKTADISEKPYAESGYSMNLIVNDSTPHTIDDIQSIKAGIAIILENYPKDYRKRVRLGVHELFLNAIEHGVIGVNEKEKYEMKRKNHFAYDIYLRSELKCHKNSTILVSYTETASALTVVIADQGNGFDWKSKLAKKVELSVDGMGIYLAQTIFTDLTYNDIGNEVTAVLIKDRK